MASKMGMMVASTAALTLLVNRYSSTRLTSPSALLTALYISLLELFCLILYSYLLFPLFLSPLRDIPRPPGSQVSHVWEFLKNPQDVPFRRWVDMMPDAEVIRFLNLFNQARLMPVSPAALADVLVHKCYDFEKPGHFRQTGTPLLGDGILFAEGDVHKLQRKIFLPSFSFRHVKDLYPLFWDKSKVMVSAIEDQKESAMANDQPLNHITIRVSDWVSRVTLDIIGEAALGKDLGATRNPQHELSLTYQTLFGPGWAADIIALLNMFLPGYLVSRLPFTWIRHMALQKKLIRETCEAQIASIRQQKDGEPATTILAAAMSSNNFSDAELIQQMTTFLVAGHETTATALSWAIYLLCKHPTMQSRLREEVHSSLPSTRDSKATITAAQVDRLPYLNAFCNEVLRFYPPVAATVREARRDTQILHHAVPKGTILLIAPWAVNSSTRLWGPTAAAFDPERWLRAADGGAESNYANLTFLHGPRSCIGTSFAKAEFLCLLAALAGSFEIALEDPAAKVVPDFSSGITVKPSGGLKVRLSPVAW